MDNNIADIVRRVVATINSLHPNQNVNLAGHSNQSTINNTPEQEINERFRLPRDTAQGQGNTLLRSTNGRFTPYRSKGKGNKGKGKVKSSHSQLDFVMKDVCLLPDPDWEDVPRRANKQNLVRHNLFIDAWTLNKTWSEEQLRKEILILFTDHLNTVNELVFFC